MSNDTIPIWDIPITDFQHWLLSSNKDEIVGKATCLNCPIAVFVRKTRSIDCLVSYTQIVIDDLCVNLGPLAQQFIQEIDSRYGDNVVTAEKALKCLESIN